MSFKKGLFQNLLVSGGYNYATQALLFFSTVITSRLLAPETFGFVGLITVFTGFVSVFADSGISLAVIRSDYGRSFHRAVDNLAILIGILLCLITCTLAYPISVFYKSPDLFWPTIVLSLTFILRSMTLVRMALLSKDLRFGTIGRMNLWSTMLQILLTVLLAFAGWSYWALIVPQLFANTALILLSENRIKLSFGLCTLPQLKIAYLHTRRTITNVMGFNLVNYWARNVDNLLVGKVFGVAELGIYNRAYNLLTMPLGIVTGLVGSVLYPSLKKLKSEGGNVHREYLFILKMISLLSFPIAAILILFPENLVLTLWGKNWIAVSRLLPYFGLLLISQCLLSGTGNILVLFEKEKAMRIGGWVSAAVMIVGIVIGSFYSIYAIAQLYSLVFILFVLPFNVSFFLVKTLRFDSKAMLHFWLPVFLLSVSIWTACYFENQQGKLAGVLLFFVLMVWQAKSEIIRFVAYFLARKRLSFVQVGSK